MPDSERRPWPRLPQDRTLLLRLHGRAQKVADEWMTKAESFCDAYRLPPIFFDPSDGDLERFDAAWQFGLAVLADPDQALADIERRRPDWHRRPRRARERGPDSLPLPFASSPPKYQIVDPFKLLPGQFSTFFLDPALADYLPLGELATRRGLLDQVREHADLLHAYGFVLFPTVVYAARQLCLLIDDLRRRIEAEICDFTDDLDAETDAKPSSKADLQRRNDRIRQLKRENPKASLSKLAEIANADEQIQAIGGRVVTKDIVRQAINSKRGKSHR